MKSLIRTFFALALIVNTMSSPAWAGTPASLILDVRDHMEGPGAGSGWSWSGGSSGSGMNPGDDGEFYYKLPLNTLVSLKALTAYVYDNDAACAFTVSLIKRSITDTDISNYTTVSTSSASVDDSTGSQAMTLSLTGKDQVILGSQIYYAVISLVGMASTSCSINGLKISGIF